ncbi:MAG: hypothetical protein QW727_04150 [Candidatus Pacearchaeota archaeon]
MKLIFNDNHNIGEKNTRLVFKNVIDNGKKSFMIINWNRIKNIYNTKNTFNIFIADDEQNFKTLDKEYEPCINFLIEISLIKRISYGGITEITCQFKQLLIYIYIERCYKLKEKQLKVYKLNRTFALEIKVENEINKQNIMVS